MKGNIKNTLTLLLMCSILLGSVGIAFQKRLCELSGIVVTSLSDSEMTCCVANYNSTFKADSCCKTELDLAQLAPVDLVKKFTLRLVAIMAPTVHVSPAFFSKKEQFFAFSDTSPPNYSYRLLHFIQVFRL